jgi:hypothetical protein
MHETILLENTPQLSYSDRQKRNRLIHMLLLDAIAKALPSECIRSLYSSPSQGVIAWEKGEWTFCFQIRPYDEFAWRLTNRWIHEHRLPFRLRKRLVIESNGATCFVPVPELLHRFELSFIGEETPLVATPELVCFIESAFSTKERAEVYKWRLFSHDESYPHYAWTRRGGAFVQRKQRERWLKEHGNLAVVP